MEHLDRLLALPYRKRTILLDNLAAIQLTNGCSVACDFCQVAPNRRVTSPIPFNGLQELVPRLEKGRPEPYRLFYANDPFDYQDGGRNIRDVLELFRAANGLSYFLVTAIPSGKEDLVLECLDAGHQIGVSTSRFRAGFEEFEGLPADVRRILQHPDTLPDVPVVPWGPPSLYAAGRGVKSVPALVSKRRGESRYHENIMLGRVLLPGESSLSGTVLTPDGIFNKGVAPVSRTYRMGVTLEPIDLECPASVKVLVLNRKCGGMIDLVELVNLAAYLAWIAFPEYPFPQVIETPGKRLTRRAAAVQRLSGLLAVEDEAIRKARCAIVAEFLSCSRLPGDLMTDSPLAADLAAIGEDVRTRFGTTGLVDLAEALSIYRHYWTQREIADDAKAETLTHCFLSAVRDGHSVGGSPTSPLADLVPFWYHMLLANQSAT